MVLIRGRHMATLTGGMEQILRLDDQRLGDGSGGVTASAQASRGAGRARASELGSRYGLVIIMFLVIALFSVMLPETYFTVLNFLTIAANQATILMLALAIVLPLIAGEFDLSVAATFGFCQLVIAGFIIRNGLPWEVALLLTLGIGAVVGLANGLLMTVLQINSFIATLGTATILGGLTQWYSGGAIIMGQFPSLYLAIGQFRIGGTLNVAVVYVVLIAFDAGSCSSWPVGTSTPRAGVERRPSSRGSARGVSRSARSSSAVSSPPRRVS